MVYLAIKIVARKDGKDLENWRELPIKDLYELSELVMQFQSEVTNVIISKEMRKNGN